MPELRAHRGELLGFDPISSLKFTQISKRYPFQPSFFQVSEHLQGCLIPRIGGLLRPLLRTRYGVRAPRTGAAPIPQVAPMGPKSNLDIQTTVLGDTHRLQHGEKQVFPHDLQILHL